MRPNFLLIKKVLFSVVTLFLFFGIINSVQAQTSPLHIVIDIKPGSYPNCYNDSKVLPVAIITTNEFDASTVYAQTLTLDGYIPPVEKGRRGIYGALEDVDGDGDLDLVVHFRAQGNYLKQGQYQVTLSGLTHDGQAIEGVDTLSIAPCRITIPG